MRELAQYTPDTWAILPDWLETHWSQWSDKVAVAKTRADFGIPDEIDKKAHDTATPGIAVIDIVGPLSRQDTFFSFFFGGTSYETIRTQLNEALGDDRIHTIVLNVDSPGGEVNGVSDLAHEIYAARSKKRIEAVASGLCASAAYWLASAAHKITASQTTLVGSIGVIKTLTDTTKMLEANGIRQLMIVSSHAPEKIHGNDGRITEEAVASVRRVLDALENVFVGDVAKARGVSDETVRSKYGKGGVFVAGSAAPDERTGLEAGLVDAIGTMESVVAGGKDRKSVADEHAIAASIIDPIAHALRRGFLTGLDARVVSHKDYGKPVGGAWDASAAVKRIRKWASSDDSGDWKEVDKKKFAQGFLFVTGTGENEGDYKEPHHDIRGGKMVTVMKGVEAAAARIGQVKGISEKEREQGKRHLAEHYHEDDRKAPWEEDKKSDARTDSPTHSAAARTDAQTRAEMTMDKDTELHGKMEACHAAVEACSAKGDNLMDYCKAEFGKMNDKMGDMDGKMDKMKGKAMDDDGDMEGKIKLSAEIEAVIGKTGPEAVGHLRGLIVAAAELPRLREQLTAANTKIAEQAKATETAAIESQLTSIGSDGAKAALREAYAVGGKPAFDAAHKVLTSTMSDLARPVIEPAGRSPATANLPDTSRLSEEQAATVLLAEYERLPAIEREVAANGGASPLEYMKTKQRRAKLAAVPAVQ